MELVKIRKRRLSVEPGMKFDRLEVIKELAPEKGKRRVLCKCDCPKGNQPVVDLYRLFESRVRSCGCLSEESLKSSQMENLKDLTDLTFERLTVLYRDENKSSKKGAFWICECSCESKTRVSVRSADLILGNTKSCGCYMRENTKGLKKYNDEHQTVDGAFVPLLRQKLQPNNKTGHKGVSVRREKNGKIRYIATITIKNERRYLGIFEKKKDAIAARKKAEMEFHDPYLEKLGRVHKRKIVCIECKEEHYVSQHWSAKYCSDRCRFKAHARKKRAQRANEGRCPQCGGEWVEPDTVQSNKPKYCKKCQQYFQNKYYKEQENSLSDEK